MKLTPKTASKQVPFQSRVSNMNIMERNLIAILTPVFDTDDQVSLNSVFHALQKAGIGSLLWTGKNRAPFISWCLETGFDLAM